MNILKKKRKEVLKLTLEELSKKANLSIMCLSAYENSKRHPHFTEIWNIKNLYELTDEELLAWLKENNNK